MSLARLHQAGAPRVASLLLVLTAATDVHSECNATCKRDIARCMATQCAGVGRAACRRRCKPAAIRTLAYVVSECRVDAAGLNVGRQALRIRRGEREPITVVEFGPGEPIPDPAGPRPSGFRALAATRPQDGRTTYSPGSSRRRGETPGATERCEGPSPRPDAAVVWIVQPRPSAVASGRAGRKSSMREALRQSCRSP